MSVERPAGAFRFAPDDPVYEVFAVRYGRAVRKRSEAFVGGDPHDGPLDIVYYVWLIRNGRRTVLVDTGFDAAEAAARKRELMLPVEDGLQRLGVDAGGIEDVVLTHLHYDHAGNHNLFPRARFHVQAAEMAYVTGPSMTHKWLRGGYGPADVKTMVDRLFADRVVFHDGRSELAPGIVLEPTPGHTPGLMAVLVNTAEGPLILASDSAVLYEGLETGRAFAPAYSAGDELKGYAKLIRLAGSADRIIPGHDAAVMSRYPAAVDDVAWRVDGAPKR